MTIWSLYLSDLGYSLGLIGWTYTVYAIPAVIIGSRAGRLSDRYGRLLPMLVPGVFLGLFWLSYGIFPFFLYFIIMGIFEGIMDTIARAANDGYLADYTPAEIRGRAQGLFSALMQFASLVASLAAGFLYEFGHNVPFLVIGGLQSAMVVVALILTLFIRRKRAISTGKAGLSNAALE
jgi:MFS family permease